jgi:hypothetical protein
MNIDLKLTPCELAYADKIITMRERFMRRWPWSRVVTICMCIVPLGLAVFIAYTLYRVGQLDYGIMGDAGDPLTADLLEMRLDNLMMQIRFEVMLIITMLVNIFVVLNVLITTIPIWGRHKEDAVFTKVARAVIATATESSGTAVE